MYSLFDYILYSFTFSLVFNICAKGHQNPNFKEMAKNDPNPHQANHPHHAGSQAPATEAPQGLWALYGEHGFMHDLNHLKEEANKLLYLQESEQITNDQSAFYYTKLHDFNSDGRLDGLELLLAVKHSLVHQNSSFESVHLEELSSYVDSELNLMDLNNDGYVDYGEIYTYIENTKKNNDPHK